MRAGLVAASTVIVVALTGIASFTFTYSFSIVLSPAAVHPHGPVGHSWPVRLIIGMAIMGIHLCTLRSFGVPYLSPVVPTTGVDLKDAVFRAPGGLCLPVPPADRQGGAEKAGTGAETNASGSPVREIRESIICLNRAKLTVNRPSC